MQPSEWRPCDAMAHTAHTGVAPRCGLLCEHVGSAEAALLNDGKHAAGKALACHLLMDTDEWACGGRGGGRLGTLLALQAAAGADTRSSPFSPPCPSLSLRSLQAAWIL